MERTIDINFMQRCIELARKAEGQTFPNPLVGSVVVHDGLIIGEGYHLKTGLPHAEVNAVGSVTQVSLLKESTLYVNLEPCSHHGKTPPCAEFIIRSGIKRVVVGSTDTSRKVSGRGISMLREAGAEVITGILEKESRWLNRRFFTFHEKQRPWIVLKWAQSADGFLDKERTSSVERPQWLTGPAERVLVHKWRSEEQSILVGAGTLRADDPGLNVREWAGKDPLRIVMSSSGNVRPFRVPGSFVLFTHVNCAAPTGAEVVVLDHDRPSCIQVCDYLFRKGLQSLFIEGGSQVLNHFIENNIWDEARIFTGSERFGSGVRAPVISGLLTGETGYSGSILTNYVNAESDFGYAQRI